MNFRETAMEVFGLTAPDLADVEVQADAISEVEWQSLLNGFADANIYQTWSYGAVRWGKETLSHIVVRRGSETIAMAQLRILRLPGIPIGVAYLRWGPLCQLAGHSLDLKTVQIMAAALRCEYVEKRGLFLEVLPNAFADSSRAQVFQEAFSGYVTGMGVSTEDYRTIVLDITPSLETLRQKLDAKWRNKLNGAERNGLEIIEMPGAEGFRAFTRMYDEMSARKQFRSSVDVAEFARMQELLPDAQKMIVLICRHGGVDVAGIVCAVLGDTGIYILGATSDDGLKQKGAYKLQWEMIKRLKDRGVENYDLGGINPEENPGVYSFKSGFSGVDTATIGSLTFCSNAASGLLTKGLRLVRATARYFHSTSQADRSQKLEHRHKADESSTVPSRLG